MKILKPAAKRSEDEWVSFIKKKFSPFKVFWGIGDDCAITKIKDKICLTTDTVIEGIDFETKWAPPEALGYKALAQNLSDLASSGAKPHSFLLTLAIPGKLKDEFVEKVISGIHYLSKKEKIELIGGDLSKSLDRFIISITALGRLKRAPLLRNNAKTGDHIYITAPLGGPDAALSLFKKGAVLTEFPLSNQIKPENTLLDRFFRPPSQTDLGQIISDKEISQCAIDISDGLLKDLSRILSASKVGAIIYAEEIPRFCYASNTIVSLKSALKGGEEQTLLFTVSPDKENLLKKHKISAYNIGEVITEKTLLLKSKGKLSRIDAYGFDHFSGK